MALRSDAADPLAGLDEADALPADLLWIESQGGGGEPAILHACAAAAARTARVGIVAAGIRTPLHHPLRIAEDLASLDGLAAGRVELALASAGDDASRLEDDLAVLRQAWSDEPVEHAGAVHTFSGVDVHPKPHRPGGPPIWLEADESAGSEAPPGAAARRAAERGVGLVAWTLDAARLYLERWAELGLPDREARIALRLPWGEPSSPPASLANALDGARVRAERAAAELSVSLVGIYTPGRTEGAL